MAQRDVQVPAGPSVVGVFGKVGRLPQRRARRSSSYVDDVAVPVRRVSRAPRVGRQASYHNSLEAMFRTDSVSYSLEWPVRLLSTVTGATDASDSKGVEAAADGGGLLEDSGSDGDGDADPAPRFTWPGTAPSVSSAAKRAIQGVLPPTPGAGSPVEVPGGDAPVAAPDAGAPVAGFQWAPTRVPSSTRRALQALLSPQAPAKPNSTVQTTPGGDDEVAAPAPAAPAPGGFQWAPKAVSAATRRAVQASLQVAKPPSGAGVPPGGGGAGAPAGAAAPAPTSRFPHGLAAAPAEVWDTLFDDASGYVYYQNVETMEIVHTRPAGAGDVVNPIDGRRHASGSGRAASGGSSGNRGGAVPVAGDVSRLTSADLARMAGNIW